MQAAVRTKYGPPDVLSIREIPVPQPGDDEILVNVHAATVNRTDCAVLRGSPLVMRLFTGLFTPKSPVTGTDFAGQIEAVGNKVRSFRVGDKVFGFDDTGAASHAQYLKISEKKAVVHIPGNCSYEQATASAEGAHYAVNFVNKVPVKPGQNVLLNGATGAIGSAALQLLIHSGARVTAVCGPRQAEWVRSRGAVRVLDFTKEDFTKTGEMFDFVFDAVGKSTFGMCKRILNQRGIYMSSELGPWWQNIFLALLTPVLGGKKVIFPVPFDIKESLFFMRELMEAGAFEPLIDRVYPLEKIREAFEYVESGQKLGNVVIALD